LDVLVFLMSLCTLVPLEMENYFPNTAYKPMQNFFFASLRCYSLDY
jgi:hypothetical protein